MCGVEPALEDLLLVELDVLHGSPVQECNATSESIFIMLVCVCVCVCVYFVRPPVLPSVTLVRDLSLVGALVITETSYISV